MQSFYLAWTKKLQKLQQLVGELSGSNLPQPVTGT